MSSAATDYINPTIPPSGNGCAECEAENGWWFHLRRCAACGHIGCCDTSPSQHASLHANNSGHPVIRSYEPDEDWYYDYTSDQLIPNGPSLAPPLHHPIEQSVPGPAERVPYDWQSYLNTQ